MFADVPTITSTSNTVFAYDSTTLFAPQQASITTTGDLRVGGNISAMNAVTFNNILQGANRVSRRLVKVMIVDPNESVPIEDCVLYMGDEKITEATDQELFFELDVKEMIENHNVKRVTFRDKRIKDKEVFLDPIKIRDLKMLVVAGASF